MTTRTESEIESVVEPVCRAHGVELVHVVKASERGGAVLRVVIDRPGNTGAPGEGVTLAECQAVSRDIAPALDVHDVVGGAYRLEVSSPGLDRPLVKLRDFARFAGSEVKVSTFAPQPDGKGGERRKFQGKLLGVDGESIRLEVDGSELQLPHSGITKANVVYKFD